MSDLSTLLALSFKAERAAGRKLARATGVGEEAALRTTLESVAGAAGLAALLRQRQLLHDAAEARASARQERKADAAHRHKARHDGPSNPWCAWFDGSAHPNPGRCGIGGLVTGPAGERIEISQAAGYGNSSEAEYRALIAVLESSARAGARELTVYGDSQVVIGDVSSSTEQGAAALAALRTEAQGLIAQFDSVALCWVPRHKNSGADTLSQRAVTALPAP